MSAYIGEGLLHHAKNCDFSFSSQTVEIRPDGKLYVDAATFPKTPQVPAKRVSEAELLQHWRMQKIADAAYFLSCLLGQPRALGKDATGSRVESELRSPQCREVHHESRKFLAGAVMQFSGDTSPLIILRVKQPKR